MKKLSLLVALSLVSTCVFAADWQYVGGSDTTFYNMDFLSIASVKAYRKAWVKINHAAELKTTDYPAKSYQSEMTLYYFDCADKTLSLTQSVLYSKFGAAGDVVNSQSIKFNPQGLREVVPGSVGEAMLNAACATPAERSRIRAKNASEMRDYMKTTQE